MAPGSQLKLTAAPIVDGSLPDVPAVDVAPDYDYLPWQLVA